MGTIGLGTSSVTFLIRVPFPPHKIITFMAFLASMPLVQDNL